MSTSTPSLGNGDGDTQGERTGWPWKKVVLYGLGITGLVGTTVVVTLAATHDSAVRENLIAYLNGRIDGADAVLSSLEDYGFCSDEFC